MQKKKLSMHAAETAYQGAIAYQAYRQVEGSRTVDEINYNWQVTSNAICVSYRLDHEVLTKCIEFDA
ncbi:hypothetical protein E2C16_06150 [Sporosarcina pasteurii]|uniref:hypothetical protein n=1 Tax=Sporosarcina pasteurii TaxID=1474 RepID=UPI00106745F1|nr:hypothetical protein [Sporosarcina pasteurii]MDS9471078.1 hypothetical protein [Sporosarcina pasteurii]QBQ05279.1 hypothetical protein E2C16_06150 [Sporosarcina pasteurii]